MSTKNGMTTDDWSAIRDQLTEARVLVASVQVVMIAEKGERNHVADSAGRAVAELDIAIRGCDDAMGAL